MADPAFAQKMGIEMLLTVGLSLAYEGSQRGDRFFQEWDYVAGNTLSLVLGTGAHSQPLVAQCS